MASKVEFHDQNGVYIEHLTLEENYNPEKVNGMAGFHMEDIGLEANAETVGESSNESKVDLFSRKEDVSKRLHVEDNSSSKKLGIKETGQVNSHKQQDVRARVKIEKSSNAKGAVITSQKKTNNDEEIKAGLSGTLSVNKQPIAKAHQMTNAVSTTSNINKIKENMPKSQTASSSDTQAQSEGTLEKTKLKSVRKGSSSSAEGNGECVVSPTGLETKPPRAGKLPSYGFSFRCDERAEKRKEFYTKREEKIHAQEVERSNLQAKSKETQEAEIKMFRKSLNFKATPMPSFYQEPSPPKVELKKIPPTRPRSPKLGRKKGSSSVEAEGDDDQSQQQPRLSLDTQNNCVREHSSQTTKRPQRKSLPRLPSEKTSLSKTTRKAELPSEVMNGSAPPIAPISIEEDPVSDGTGNGLLVEDQTLSTIEQKLQQ